MEGHPEVGGKRGRKKKLNVEKKKYLEMWLWLLFKVFFT